MASGTGPQLGGSGLHRMGQRRAGSAGSSAGGGRRSIEALAADGAGNDRPTNRAGRGGGGCRSGRGGVDSIGSDFPAGGGNPRNQRDVRPTVSRRAGHRLGDPLAAGRAHADGRIRSRPGGLAVWTTRSERRSGRGGRHVGCFTISSPRVDRDAGRSANASAWTGGGLGRDPTAGA